MCPQTIYVIYYELNIPRTYNVQFLQHLDDHDDINNLPHPDGPRKTIITDEISRSKKFLIDSFFP